MARSIWHTHTQTVITLTRRKKHIDNQVFPIIIFVLYVDLLYVGGIPDMATKILSKVHRQATPNPFLDLRPVRLNLLSLSLSLIFSLSHSSFVRRDWLHYLATKKPRSFPNIRARFFSSFLPHTRPLFNQMSLPQLNTNVLKVPPPPPPAPSSRGPHGCPIDCGENTGKRNAWIPRFFFSFF